MSDATFRMVARLAVTLALIALAGVLVLVSSDAADHSVALSIVGAVVGYWLSHAESSISGVR